MAAKMDLAASQNGSRRFFGNLQRVSRCLASGSAPSFATAETRTHGCGGHGTNSRNRHQSPRVLVLFHASVNSAIKPFGTLRETFNLLHDFLKSSPSSIRQVCALQVPDSSGEDFKARMPGFRDVPSAARWARSAFVACAL